VLAFRDVPVANIDHAIERHLGRDDQSSHRVTSPLMRKKRWYPIAGKENDDPISRRSST
jgi:hypothetical protein